MEEKKNKSQASDEIDIYRFFSLIGKGLGNIANSTLKFLAYLRQTFFDNKIFFAATIFVGLGLGAFFSEFLNTKYYKSSMILSCDYLNGRIVTNTFDKLNLLCAESERMGLAEELKIDRETAKNILQFEGQPFIAEKDLIEIEVLKEQLNNVAENKKDLVAKVIKKIDIENKHAFQIEVTVLNPEIVKELEMALVKYFGSNSYIKNRVEINRINLLKRKNKLTQDSKKLDSLKSVIYDNLQSMAKQTRSGGSNNVILGDKAVANPIEVFQEDLSFNEQLLKIDEKLFTNSDFEIVDGFTTFKQPESAGLLKILVISFFISWLVAYSILGLWKFDRYLAKLSKEPN